MNLSLRDILTEGVGHLLSKLKDFGGGLLDCALQQFFNCPLVICDSGCLCWCLAMRGMNPAKVEIGHSQRNGVGEIFNLAGKARRQSGESFIEMAQRTIEPFGV
jgi:hypothetical protein